MEQPQHRSSSNQPPPYSLWAHAAHADQVEEQSRGKRPRVTLACQRCKTRKQKCDGASPCSKCQTNNHACEYVVPQKPMPFGKKQYILALERRVAELETILATHGMSELSSDHWKSEAQVTSSLSTSYQTQSALSEQKSNHSSAVTEPDEGSPNQEDILDWSEGVDPVVSVLRSLSLDVNGSGYVGASSHVALGRLFSFLGPKDEAQRGASRRRSQRSSIGTGSNLQTQSSPDMELPMDINDVPANTADRLYAGYLKHIATRWPICHTVWIKEIHQSRHSLTAAQTFERAMLHLVYATSGRFIETTGEPGAFHPKRHYAAATTALGTILIMNDIRTVQILMLMAVYCLRDPVGAGAWTCSRTALLVAIDHGMHRQTKPLSKLTMENQLRKRLFWSCYAFDRQISIPLGRPFGISDRDIDIELPLDISEDTTDEQLSSASTPTGTHAKSTSLTSFLLIVRLRQIESDIQQTIYRVDQTAPIEDSVIEGFLNRLDAWRALVPEDTRRFKDSGHVPFDGFDFYMVYYFKCKRLLLYPQISKSSVAPKYLKECARACAGVCGAYKRLHQTLAVGYSVMALQTVFMAGLTLVYCLWISPNEIFNMTTSNGIHDCSIVLFVIAERVPSAKKYRNAFEVIRQRVIDQISQESAGRPRKAVTGLTADLAPSAHSFTVDMPLEVDNGSFEQFSQIITDMAGEDFSFHSFSADADGNAPSMSFPAHTNTGDIQPQILDASSHDNPDFAASFDFPMDPGLQYGGGPGFFTHET